MGTTGGRAARSKSMSILIGEPKDERLVKEAAESMACRYESGWSDQRSDM